MTGEVSAIWSCDSATKSKSSRKQNKIGPGIAATKEGFNNQHVSSIFMVSPFFETQHRHYR
jgi:hypothetical protein